MSYNPLSTYRIQLSSDFTLKELQDIIPYLHFLGIKTIYASPVLQAQSGSTHGYDVTDPHTINPELGTETDLETIHELLKSKNMGWLQDIVPNHMAYSHENKWMMDIFRKGPDSEYHGFFDIDWEHPEHELNGKVMLPFFGSPVSELIQNNEIYIEYKNGEFFLRYYENEYPLSYRSYTFILKSNKLQALPGKLKDIINGFEQKQWYTSCRQLKELANESQPIYDYISKCLSNINLHREVFSALLQLQYFYATHWRKTEKLINYRRFFTINGLISLRMAVPSVFSTYHKKIKTLCDKGIFNGLRIDHIDGLYNPGDYLRRLRKLVGEDQYLIVEKILEENEELESSWPVEGNTGYDFGALVNNLLLNQENDNLLSESYKKWQPDATDYKTFIRERKAFILHERMSGDLDNLLRLAFQHPVIHNAQPDQERMRRALAEFLIHCPVYKIYRRNTPPNPTKDHFINRIIDAAIKYNPAIKDELELLREIFLKESQKYTEKGGEYSFFYRVMQFSGPLMAKGLEDTAFYSFSRFIGLNEVGDNPQKAGIRNEEFHDEMQIRNKYFPLTMNATSTHDSKRGEDFRARLAVISDLANEWDKNALAWRKINEEHKKENIPDANDEYFIYQTLAGSYPISLTHDDNYTERVKKYIIKVLREAKEHSSWTAPDKKYEDSTTAFIEAILNSKKFLKKFKNFTERLIDPGIINSLAQVILKHTCPGIPDTYQGCEKWNFSFVDPDNRRDIDFSGLYTDLKELKNKSFSELWNNRENGNIKLWLTQKLLQLRNNNPALFEQGEYIPLETEGKHKDKVMAYARYHKRQWLIVVIPQNITAFNKNITQPQDLKWDDTRILLPPFSPVKWRDQYDQKRSFEKEIVVKDLLKENFYSVLSGTNKELNRRSGILMHISSLPGKYGSGDFGDEIYSHIDFLHRTGQNYWQILPLSVTSAQSGYSPYSSISAFAGNILFISIDELQRQNLIRPGDLNNIKPLKDKKANFSYTEKIKQQVIQLAYQNYLHYMPGDITKEFYDFKQRSDYWLDDYALFVLFREMNHQKNWSEWPEKMKMRDPEVLDEYQKKHHDRLEEIRFSQYLFLSHWLHVKEYANNKGVKVFGDIPIYVNHNSADVWAHPEMFKLDKNGKMESVAGVPPDYFNKNGQLWGMPIYRWDYMQDHNYGWWKNRLKKNLELFDLVRIDHFRGFSKYWEVAANEKTAVNGKWVEGPAENFFDAIKEVFPDLPFVAEDLGDIDQPVYDLRDRYSLPGMNVLQFAFGDNINEAVHIPHNQNKNSITYTGTHDNNTVKGWFAEELNQVSRKRLELYLGKHVQKNTIHFDLIRMAFSSPAEICIIPMQDYLGLDSKHRMNQPSTEKDNWKWRLNEGDAGKDLEKIIQILTRLYGRF